jgi:integrase
MRFLHKAYTRLFYTSDGKAEVVSKIHNNQIDEILNNGLNGNMQISINIDDWIQTYSSDRTTKKRIFLAFCEWLGKTPEEILKLRRQDQTRTFEKLCIKYFHYLVEEKGLDPNTTVNKLGTVRSFFQFYDLPLNFKRNEIPSMKLKPYTFSLRIEHIRRMFQFANIWQKAIMITMLETGLRISDILNLKRSDVENMLQMENIEMEVSTLKEGVLAKIHLSNEAREIFKLYLSTLKPSQTRMFKKSFDSVSKALKQLFNKAFPDLKVNITPHDFRRLFISTASNIGVNEWHIKHFVGKTVPSDVLTYLRNLDLKGDFQKIKQKLTINPINEESKNELEHLTFAVENLEHENIALKTRVEVMQKTVKEQPERIISALEKLGIKIRELYEE